MTTTDDKKHLRRFFEKDDSTMAPEGRWPDPELSLPSSCKARFFSTEPIASVTIGNDCRIGDYELLEKGHGAGYLLS
jgi:hypothetical protein